MAQCTHTFLLVKLYRFTDCSSFSSLHHSSVCLHEDGIRHWQTMTVDKSQRFDFPQHSHSLPSTFNNLDTNERFTRIFSFAFRTLNSKKKILANNKKLPTQQSKYYAFIHSFVERKTVSTFPVTIEGIFITTICPDQFFLFLCSH